MLEAAVVSPAELVAIEAVLAWAAIVLAAIAAFTCAIDAAIAAGSTTEAAAVAISADQVPMLIMLAEIELV